MQTEIDRLSEQLGSWRWMLLVAAALESGIFEALDTKPSGRDELAGRLGLEQRATYIVAEALVDGGFLLHADGRWQVTDAARRLLLDQADPAYTAPVVLHGRDLAARWLNLPEVLKGQQPVSRRASAPGNFTATMAAGARTSAPVVVEHCLAHLPEARRILDVGGGPGVHARAFLDHGLAVIIFDLPSVIDLVRPQWGSVTGVTLVGGDFTRGLPEGPFDLVLLGNVCHIYGPDENRRLFQHVANVLAPEGGVAIIDFVRGRSPAAALFGVNMLAAGGTGDTWTEAEYRAWLTEAGFGEIQVEDVGASQEEIGSQQRQLIFARKTETP
jgi:SAM-dependent methyltransferase